MEFVYSDIEIFNHLNLAGFIYKDKAVYYVNTPTRDYNSAERIETDFGTIYINVPQNERRESFKAIQRHGVLAFFNGHSYDSQLIENVMSWDFKHTDIYELLKTQSDNVIAKKARHTWDKNLIEFDLKEQLPPNISLKKFEAMNGKPILESSILFNKPDNFSREEIMETIEYNHRDLLATIELADVRSSYIHGKELLIKHYANNEPVNWKTSNGTIAGKYLMGWNKLDDEDQVEVDIDYKDLPEEAVGFLKEVLVHSRPLAEAKTQKEKTAIWKPSERSLERFDFDNIVAFGSGGIHSAKGHFETTRTGRQRAKYNTINTDDVWQLDVTSLFPNIIINYDLLGKTATPEFRKMVKERVQNKKTNPELAQAQKIIVNSVYGLLRLPSSQLFQPTNAGIVNVLGQVATYTLAQRYSKVADIIQMNTDAVTFKLKAGFTKKDIADIKENWEKDFNLGLETTHFKKFVQRDVNNYIAITDNDHVKAKGALSRSQGEDVLKNTSPRIIQVAIANYLLYDKPIEESIKEGSPLDYVFILHVQKTANLTGRILDANNQPLSFSTQRVYCSINGSPIYKERKDRSTQKFPNAPENAKIINGSLDNMNDIDYTYYIELANKALENWIIQE